MDRIDLHVEVTPVSSTAHTVKQEIFFVDKGNKKHLLLHLLSNNDIQTALVFTRTKHGADRVAKDLNKAGIKAEAIPMGRFAEPPEVAEMVKLLCSPAGRYITGQTLHVNGGVYLP